MDISRRLSSEDTATSMYLSFDAESTMSTACYKTLDISLLSAIDSDDSLNENKTNDNHMNSTLEARDGSQVKSPLKTVKKMEMPELKSHTPLKALPKNVLKKYKDLCSTPSKEQLLKTVDVTRGSEATRCVDLGLAFLGVEDEKPAYFPPPFAEVSEENKENALPEIEEVSTLSTCSSVEITTSIIEKKTINSASSVGIKTEEESVENIKNVEKFLISTDKVEVENDSILDNSNNIPKAKEAKNVEENLFSIDTVDKILVISNLLLDDANIVSQAKNTVNLAELGKPNREKDKVQIAKYMDTITETKEKPDEMTSEVNKLENVKKKISKKSGFKPKVGVVPLNLRRSMCEPNLQANKPSRIYSFNNKRQSLLPTCTKSNMNIDAVTEIPLLMNKMLKISNNTTIDGKNELKKRQQLENDEKTEVAGNRSSFTTKMRARTSVIPSAAGDKRSFSFTKRMSVVVKTTLNSPARKISRKSLGVGVIELQRKSVMTQKRTVENSKIKKPEIIARKSMLPKSSTITATITSGVKTIAPLQETSVKETSTALRKSLYTAVNGKLNTVSVALSNNKPDIGFTCDVCGDKFQIKSLLDAHKRSHESDMVAPSFIKKSIIAPLSSNGSMLVSSNQCKYCDKKFALKRALHIHLLQNCIKIPPSEKRKLEYTDLNHVEKAQLPKVFANQQNLTSNASSTVSSAISTPQNTLKLNFNSFAVPKMSSLPNNKDIHKISPVDGNNLTALKGSVQKTKKRTAHSGVYRTPSKSLPCHLCKLTFKSILDYTNHNLTTHGSNKANKAGNTDNYVERK